jgi:hypothetical protein
MHRYLKLPGLLDIFEHGGLLCYLIRCLWSNTAMSDALRGVGDKESYL